ncbi:MarR family transcriptional regulator [Pseudotabrizicola sediminis]|uniref:MarR family transcriptional regulator n=1 Tax=Pseudotabrizicola sediminis TaxID=2486418 RepID=A0ABY2KHL1_9RHOB|nr:MarR family transcriptional regulator [Pseudotabrizicola sediminis]TGD41797.1 MarR family transcriptional regulator [Pseudotabrizicola sediminis]
MTDERGFLTNLVLPAARIASREIAAALAPLGLAPAQYAILDLIGRHGGMRPAMIARRLDLETSTTTNTLQRTERDGFIDRQTEPNNSRMVLISLSEKGKTVLVDARVAVQDVEARALAGTAPENMEGARVILARVMANLK